MAHGTNIYLKFNDAMTCRWEMRGTAFYDRSSRITALHPPSASRLRWVTKLHKPTKFSRKSALIFTRSRQKMTGRRGAKRHTSRKEGEGASTGGCNLTVVCRNFRQWQPPWQTSFGLTREEWVRNHKYTCARRLQHPTISSLTYTSLKVVCILEVYWFKGQFGRQMSPDTVCDGFPSERLI